MRPETSNVMVFFFVMEGCPACAEFKPIFDAAAKQYRKRVPVTVLKAEDPRAQAFAAQHGVEAMPTVLVLFRGLPNKMKFEGAHAFPETVMIFECSAQLAGQ